ncbi:MULTISPECIES: ATP-binding protein [Streptomyces]|uniref:ATP-binding protein n=1 Tax=Streptomyces TaxID=1883 RepID=UPI001F0BC620|nr:MULTISPECIES: ATP-binding protein [Streptomyces]
MCVARYRPGRSSAYARYASANATSASLPARPATAVANAVRYGHVRGRDFRVRLVLRDGVVRVEVADGRTDRLPVLREPTDEGEGEGGRGLLLVAAVAERWGVEPRPGAPYKVVWAEIRVQRAGA